MSDEVAPPGREKKKKIVFVSGCYDVLHGGHLEFFSRARALGDHLVVSFAGDESLRAHKGGRIPSIPTPHKKASAECAACMGDAGSMGQLHERLAGPMVLGLDC